MRLGGAAGGDDCRGEAEHRVLAVLETGGAGVVGLTERADPPAAVRPDVAADGDGGVDLEVGQEPALLDVELDERAHPPDRLGVGPQCLGVTTGRTQRLGHRHSLAVGERAGPVGRHGAGEDSRPGTRHPEAGTLLVDEVHDTDGAVGLKSTVAQRIQRSERRHDSQGSVERATVRHGVEV